MFNHNVDKKEMNVKGVGGESKPRVSWWMAPESLTGQGQKSGKYQFWSQRRAQEVDIPGLLSPLGSNYHYIQSEYFIC